MDRRCLISGVAVEVVLLEQGEAHLPRRAAKALDHARSRPHQEARRHLALGALSRTRNTRARIALARHADCSCLGPRNKELEN